MKANLLAGIFLFLLFSCSGADIKKERTVTFENVPKNISDAFSKHHPHIKTNFHLQDLSGVQSYEVHFQVDGKEISERYSLNGEIIERERQLNWADLPEKVRTKMENFLKGHDGDYSVQDTQEVKSEGFSGYEAKVRTKKSRTNLMEYFFNSDGSINHQEEVKLESIPTLN